MEKIHKRHVKVDLGQKPELQMPSSGNTQVVLPQAWPLCNRRPALPREPDFGPSVVDLSHLLQVCLAYITSKGVINVELWP